MMGSTGADDLAWLQPALSGERPSYETMDRRLLVDEGLARGAPHVTARADAQSETSLIAEV